MYEQIDQAVENIKDEMIKEISAVLKFNSVQSEPVDKGPFGEQIKKSLEYTLNLGEKLGFKVKNVDGYAGHIEMGEGGKLFGVLGHLDIVPAGTGWSVDPFSGIIKDGYIWGRGTVDDKGPVISSLYAMKVLKNLGIEPKNRIRLIIGTNEESGWECVEHYFKKEPLPDEAIAPDASFPAIFAEKGILQLVFSKKIEKMEGAAEKIIKLNCGEARNMVPPVSLIIIESSRIEDLEEKINSFRCKRANLKVQWKRAGNTISVEFRGKSAHGSTPEQGENSIWGLLELSEILDFGDELNSLFSLLRERLYEDIEGVKLGIAGKDMVAGPLTCNLGILSIENGMLKGNLDIRFPVFFNEPMLTKQIGEALRPFEIKKTGGHEPLFVSPDSTLIKTLMEVYEEVTGVKEEPVTMGGGTYARAVPCGVAFGIYFPGEEELAHKPDERLSIDSLMKATKIYTRLFYKWLTR